jgi:hypothetical protein
MEARDAMPEGARHQACASAARWGILAATDMDTIPGKLELTIKINQLPIEVTTDKNGWKAFAIDCEGRRVSVKVRPRMWLKLEEAAKSYPQWVAAITGRMGPSAGQGFALEEPSIQVFEKKAPPPPPEGGEPPPMPPA